MAIMKAIFDRVDNLKPWGLLLGDERPEKKRKAKQNNIIAYACIILSVPLIYCYAFPRIIMEKAMAK